MGTKPSKPGVAHFQVEFRVLGNVPIYLVKSPGLLGSVPILGVYLVLYFFLLGKITFSKIYHLRNSPNVLDSRQNRLEQINQAVSGGRVDRRGGGKSHFDISFLL